MAAKPNQNRTEKKKKNREDKKDLTLDELITQVTT